MHGTVVLTGSAGSFPGLAEHLRVLSLKVEECPLMTFAPPLDWAPFDTAVDAAFDATSARPHYSAIAFTSPRSAQAFADRLVERGVAPPAGDRLVELWAAGPGTARALAGLSLGVRVPREEEVGRHGAAAALAGAMLDAGIDGRILFPCGDHRRDELPARLRDDGLEVDDVVCYRSVLASEKEARAAAEGAEVLVVASPSVADLLARSCPSAVRPALVAVGPITAAASRASGWVAAAVAKHPTAEAIGAAVRSLDL